MPDGNESKHEVDIALLKHEVKAMKEKQAKIDSGMVWAGRLIGGLIIYAILGGLEL